LFLFWNSLLRSKEHLQDGQVGLLGGPFTFGEQGCFLILLSHLADILIFPDFPGVFDRKATQKQYRNIHTQAEDMFRPEGITLDFGSGCCRYVAFERSAVMGRSPKCPASRPESSTASWKNR